MLIRQWTTDGLHVNNINYLHHKTTKCNEVQLYLIRKNLYNNISFQ